MKKIILLTLGLLLLLPVSALAESLSAGERLYNLHCAACHGPDGRGGGPVADALAQVPTDLTKLTYDNDGRFPAARIIRQINGTDPLSGHGGSMPVYGYFFKGAPIMLPLVDGGAINTTSPIADLVTWLAQIQRS